MRLSRRSGSALGRVSPGSGLVDELAHDVRRAHAAANRAVEHERDEHAQQDAGVPASWTYIAEEAPAEKRAAHVGTAQLAWSVGPMIEDERYGTKASVPA